jgi:hypothetical protein
VAISDVHVHVHVRGRTTCAWADCSLGSFYQNVRETTTSFFPKVHTETPAFPGGVDPVLDNRVADCCILLCLYRRRQLFGCAGWYFLRALLVCCDATYRVSTSRAAIAHARLSALRACFHPRMSGCDRAFFPHVRARRRFGVRTVTIGNNFLILLAVAARLLATGPSTYHWIVVWVCKPASPRSAVANATKCFPHVFGLASR